jgi:hypothetical protein
LHKLGIEFGEASPELWGSHYDPNSLETPDAVQQNSTSTRR